MDIGETKENCDYENYNNIKEDIKMSSKINDFLRNDDINIEDENEYKEIKDELEKYKKEKEKEVEDLEKELNQLKQENAKFDKVNDENDDILLSEQTIDKLKEDIIKDIEDKIDTTIQEKIDKEIPNIKKNNEIYINKIYNKTIPAEIMKWKNIIKKIENQSQIMNKTSDNLKQKENNQPKVIPMIIKNEPKLGNSSANIQTYKNGESPKNSNLFNKPQNKKNNNLNNKNNNDISYKFDPNFKNEKPMKSNDNIIINISSEQEQSLKQLKQNIYKELFIMFNNIFFKNKEQTSFNSEKINEFHREKLENKYFNFKKLKIEYILTNYFDNFLRANVLKIFQRKNEDERVIENIKHNIETILEIFQSKKYLYQNYYYPNNKTGIRDRKKSTEAARRFRETFNIDESIIKEEELIKKLDQNDNDINKVMQQIFG